MHILPDEAKIARDVTWRHRWDVSPDEAVAIQKRLRGELAQGETIRIDKIHTVAGVDA